ncbi:hypothetical protein C8029_18750 [Roseobacter sp. TSBP12]|nr:hypothetical protein C8029_18750 [Roseobacter sp. TSBP12]
MYFTINRYHKAHGHPAFPCLVEGDVTRGQGDNGSRKIHMSETPRIERLWGFRRGAEIAGPILRI